MFVPADHLGVYYLPLFYQARGHSATRSGIDILPFMLSIVFGTLASSVVTMTTGRYWYLFVGTPLVSCIGAGLLFTMDKDIS